MSEESEDGIPLELALLLVERHRFPELAELIAQTESELKLYGRLIRDQVSRIQELPEGKHLTTELKDLVRAARGYAERHHDFTQKLDVETSFRKETGAEFGECMVHIIMERHRLLELLDDAESKYLSVPVVNLLSHSPAM